MKEDLIQKIKFDEKGLVPAIAQDAYTGAVLMQAYTNKQALELTLKTKKAHYFSRSRNAIWQKGETSGCFQEVVAVTLDCDYDSVLLKVIQKDNACHTGAYSCFFNTIQEFDRIFTSEIIYKDIACIKDRKINPKEGSYTTYLLENGTDKICKKIGEEAAEVIIAAKNSNNDELAEEIADLIYHTLVLMEDRGLDVQSVFKVLDERSKRSRSRVYPTKAK
ncbi:MAG: bifunctional phosphoribosyl-AMP cyclohydrolase/phosphoribosyl-ATP diphosphatase HisIE [Clostridiales bacterium]|nr:bifunctional phosphoribosyl-AMP cyclohydrolase/phosphoribosyl-ATP diphosphatase HisIE [Clostridiales bacterium]